MDEDVHSVVNIRLPLEDFSFRRHHKKLLRKNDSCFFVTIGKARITAEAEALYQMQKKRFRGFIHNSLSEIFHDGFDASIYPTQQVSVYDGEKLVAVSFFDMGEFALASLLCLHHPDYLSFSLGIYTILKEIEMAQTSGLRWYYPGYILDHTTLFDYKLGFGNFEWLDHNHKWSSMSNYLIENTNGHELRQKLHELSLFFIEQGIAHSHKIYPHFVVAYTGHSDKPLLRYPAFLEMKEGFPGKKIISTYDMELGRMVMMEACVIEPLSSLIHLDLSDDYSTSCVYCMDLLVVEKVLDQAEMQLLLGCGFGEAIVPNNEL